jgi:membrane-associated protease RseP (regulator of RpoE activity)
VEDDKLPPRAWLARNGFYLVLFAGLCLLLYRWMGLDGMWYIAKAGLGLSFIIFIHELGHFAVAKWCDVHVQTFSIGFGPALPGCSFKYGETTYKLALFPLGGYVKMVGEGDSDPEAANDPRSFKKKSVGQRMAIISAGVIMNVILAFVCFIIVFSHGKEREPAVAGAVDTGGPAYENGISSGAEFTRIGSRTARPGRPLYFVDLQGTVALSTRGALPFAWKVWPEPPTGPDVTARTVEADIEPRRGKNDLRPMIGLSPAESTQLVTAEMVRKTRPYPVDYRSPAAAARPADAFRPGDVITATTDPDNPAAVRPLPEVALDDPSRQGGAFELSQRWRRLAGQEVTVRVRREGEEVELKVPAAHFEFGDTIIGTTDPDHPDQVTPLPEDPRYPGLGKGDVFDYYRRLDRLAGKMMTFRVRRQSGETADLLVPPNYHYTLGVRMQIGPVGSLREKSPAAAAGVRTGDILIEVKLSTAKGDAAQTFYLSLPKKGKDEPGEAAAREQLVDPLQLPELLRRWADAHRADGVKVALTVLRDDPETKKSHTRKLLPEVDWDFAWRYDREMPLGNSSPWPVPELGLAYRVETTVDDVVGPPASGPDGLQKGDVIQAVRFRAAGKEWGESKEGDWTDLEPNQWARAFFVLQHVEFREVGLRVERNGGAVEVNLTPQPVQAWPMAERGVLLQVQRLVQKADGIVQAVEFGVDDTIRGLQDVYLSLRGVLLRRLSVKNFGGPITIANLAYRFAQMNTYEFLFFLGMISISLAAFNFLPIPILDGGHMVFLVYEKLRGKPASEQVQWGATLIGLAILGTLMIGVFVVDIMKLL